MVDVEDCAAAAQALIATGRADPDKIAIEGGSAGGFTTLAALCFTDVFRVAACRYAVCDLTAMAEDTHRFEARYLDGLVGEWPAQRMLYDKRSPLNHAAQIRCPVLFFQGLQDKVVPPEQTKRMADALRSNGIPVEVQLFEDEGHGFRNQATQIAVLKQPRPFPVSPGPGGAADLKTRDCLRLRQIETINRPIQHSNKINKTFFEAMLQRWRKEFVEFFFTKGSALTVAIAFVVGQQFTRIVDSLTKDLLMPLLNPLVPRGNFKDLKIDYFGGAIEIGNLIDPYRSAFSGLDALPDLQGNQTDRATKRDHL